MRNTVQIKYISGKDDHEKTFEKAFQMLDKANGGSRNLGKGVHSLGARDYSGKVLN